MKHIVWLFDGNHLKHPFIRLGAETLTEHDYKVTVLDKATEVGALNYNHLVSDVSITNSLNQILELNPNIIIATLPTALFVGSMAKTLINVRLVYYPFELYGEQLSKFSQRWLDTEINLLSEQVDAIITQNDERAKIYSDERHSHIKPAIVHNYKPARRVNKTGKLRSLLGIPEDKRIVLYEGILHVGRALDRLVQAAAYLPDDTIMVFLGELKGGWTTTVKPLLSNPELAKKIVVGPCLKQDDLLEYIADADVGMIIYDPVVRNNIYCEPGKLSDYVFAGVPVAASNLPTLGPVIQDHKIGSTFDSPDPQAIAMAINEVLDLPSDHWTESMQQAQQKFTWETQVPTFIETVTGEQRINTEGQPELVSKQRKDIEVLWMVEHIAREMDVACAVKALAESRFDLNIEIRNVYQHAAESLRNLNPRVVVHPFFYFKDGALATDDYVEIWPEAVHFNLAWEEIHYKAHLKLKAPADDFTRNNVIHHAWGNFYKQYLMSHGVPTEHIFVNGQPAYQLYLDPYKGYYQTRSELAARYGLDPDSRWIFVPENYRWAFLGSKINLFTKLGGDPKEMRELEEFSTKSLKELLLWCNETAKHEQITIIYRPRPAINSRLILDFFTENIGQKQANLHFIKDESVREWILASDVVISSYSTSLIEAAIADKPIYMVEPIPLPEGLWCDWYEHTPRLLTAEDFERACLSDAESGNIDSLKTWAQHEMLSHGDPIWNLARFINDLVSESKQGPAPQSATIELPARNYFNPDTHEKDCFDPADLNLAIQSWKNILDTVDWQSSEYDITPDTIINKSMSRADLTADETQPTIRALNELIKTLYDKGLSMSSWIGTSPGQPREKEALQQGVDQRLNYQPLPDAADDLRIPWFLYWEIAWVMKTASKFLKPGMRVLDAGGTSSLFTFYLASLGVEVHSVDLNEKLKGNGDKVAEAMGWNMHSYTMDLRELSFPDGYFDHAFSICVFEHLDYDIKQAALAEISRCLKPDGIFSITFDYRNPAPGVVGYGKDPRPRNQLKSIADIDRTFLASGHFELTGNPDFRDNNESYLLHPLFNNAPYTFGALFLKKKPQTASPGDKTKISIIVCTYNRSEFLAINLEGLASQNYQGSDYEIIVVDNNSTDDTASIVAKYQSRIRNLKYVKEQKQGLSHARNCGFMAARGEYLAYLDDDAVAPPVYLTSLMQVLSAHAPDLAGGPIYPIYINNKPLWFHDSLEIRKYAESSGFSTTAPISGGNFIIRKDLLATLGLFDAGLGMTGDRIGMLEERKVLEVYRAQTPGELQKVYYSLECAVDHHVLPERMQIRTILERAFAAGTSACMLWSDLHQDDQHNICFIKLFGGSKMIKAIIQNPNAKGAAAVGLLIPGLKDLSYAIGYLNSMPEPPASLSQLFDYLPAKLGETDNLLEQLLEYSATATVYYHTDLRNGILFIADTITALFKKTAEKFQTVYPDFDENYYLANNAEAKTMVEQGFFNSGFEHFIKVGQFNACAYSPDHTPTPNPIEEIDVLWLIEHVARELDVACAASVLAMNRHGLSVKIRNMFLHFNEFIHCYEPKVVILPYCYSMNDPVIKEMAYCWPKTIFINLAWEEIFYQGHVKIKAPADEFSRAKVIHLAWGDFFKEYLKSHLVNERNILVNGNPAYQLYLPPYRDYYAKRQALAEKYGLDSQKTWVLVPENYRWAFHSDGVLEWRASQGMDPDELREMRSFARHSLAILLNWCQKSCQNSSIELIFRPKPATHLNEMLTFFNETSDGESHPNLHFIKDESVREWILASDLVISSFSTSLIEAAIAAKPVYMVEPIPIPESFSVKEDSVIEDWYQFLPRLKTHQDFQAACCSPNSDTSSALRDWAVRTMLAKGDPIENLADILAGLISHRTDSQSGDFTVPEALIIQRKRYFEIKSHEHDIFNDQDLQHKLLSWAEVLNAPIETDGYPQRLPEPPADFVEETYLQRNPEVRELIESGKFISGWNHLYSAGLNQKRQAYRRPSPATNALNILIVVHNSPGRNLAGTEIYSLMLAKELQQMGHKVRIVCPDHDPDQNLGSLSDSQEMGIDITRINVALTNVLTSFKNEQSANFLAEYVAQGKFDLVHFQHLLGFSGAAPAAIAELGIPSLLTLHDGWLICEQFHFVGSDGSFCIGGPETVTKCVDCKLEREHDQLLYEQRAELQNIFELRRLYLQMQLTKIDAVLTPSVYMQKRFEKHGFNHPNFIVSPLGIKEFTPLPKTHSAKIRFAFLGNIFPTKGLDIALDAFSSLNPQNAQLEIHGKITDFDYYAQCQAKIKPDAAIHYRGEYKPDDLAKILAAIDVAIIPSRAENYPGIVRECLQGRVPVIAPNLGGIPEIITDGSNGLLYRPGDINDLASKIDYFCAAPKRISQFSEKIKPPLTIADEATRLAKIYQEIVGKIEAKQDHQVGQNDYYSHDRPEVQQLVPPTARRILDVGCGAGKLGQGLKAGSDRFVAGIEYDRQAADMARSALDHVYAGDATAIIQTIADNSFDTVIMADFIEHIQDTQTMLAEVRRVLEPGGRLILSIPNIRHWSVLKDLIEGHFDYVDAGILDRTHLRFFTRESISRTLNQSGFTVKQISGLSIKDIQVPSEFIQACAESGLNTSTLTLEGQVSQYLIVAEPMHQKAESTLTSIIILTYNQLKYTKLCLQSIENFTDVPYELIIVDNGSTDGTVEYLQKFKELHQNVQLIINEENRGFAGGNNQGIEAAQGDYILFLNNDVVVTENWLSQMLRYINHTPEIGMVGPVSNAVSGSQYIPNVSYQKIDDMHVFANAIATQNAGQANTAVRLVGFCLLAKREVIDLIGGFDEGYGAGNFEDDDLCLRSALAGYMAVIAQDVFIHHFGNMTFRGNNMDYNSHLSQNRDRFIHKWPGIINFNEDLNGYAIAIERTDRSHWLNQWGEEAFEAGDLNRALKLFERALKLDPEDLRTLNNLGVFRWQLGDQLEAQKLFEKILRQDPSNADAIHNLMAICNGEPDPAIMTLIEPYLDNPQTISTPLVSVIMPTYNRPDKLPQAIRSVLEQSEANFELIVINDGGEEPALDGFNDPRIILINHEERRGQAAARNTGIKAAQGHYIAYLDDDDIYYPQHLETLTKAASISGVAYSDAYRVFIDDTGNEKGRDVPFCYDFDRDLMLVTNYIPLPCLLHRRDCLNTVGLFDEELNVLEDWELIIRLAINYDFSHIKSFTAEFRKFSQADSVTRAGMDSSLAVTEEIHRRYSQYADEETRKAQIRRIALLKVKLGGESGYSLDELCSQLINDGEECFNAGDLDRARFFFENALELQPGNAEALTDLGVLSSQQSDPHQATLFFIRALQKDPAHTDALFNLVNLLEQLPQATVPGSIVEKVKEAAADSELIARLERFRENA